MHIEYESAILYPDSSESELFFKWDNVTTVVLGEEAEASARLALQGLEKRLTLDGYLDAVAEANRGGIKFQRETKGSICQWGMGLFAQLIAELAPPES